MESSIWKQAAKFLREKKIYRRWLVVFLCLAVIVTAGTITVLKYTGQAMTYKQKVLKCAYQVHEHNADCYDSEQKLICGLADYVVHVHNDDCYHAGGKLVCTLPEVEEHKHDGTCYTEALGDLQCTLPEHLHEEECYGEDGQLTCEIEEHKHTGDCYNKNTVLSCGKLENHTHSETTCYDKEGKLLCPEIVLEEHVHGEECFEIVEMTAEEIAAMNAPSQTADAAETSSGQNAGNTIYKAPARPNALAEGAGAWIEYWVVYDNHEELFKEEFYPATAEDEYTIQLTKEKPTRDGYSFLGWSTDPSGVKGIYKPGAEFTIYGWGSYFYNQILYAVWGDAAMTSIWLHTGDDEPITVDVEEDAVFSEALDQAWLSDSVPALECKWYADEGCTQEVDLTAASAKQYTHLYTKSYTLTLNLTQGKDLTARIRVYEGRTPQKRDFVVNGVDYYPYQYTIDGEETELNLDDLLSGSFIMEKDISATSDDSLQVSLIYNINLQIEDKQRLKHCVEPTVQGESTYIDTIASSELGDYEWLRPTVESYMTTTNQSDGALYEFKGWKRSEDRNSLSEEELRTIIASLTPGENLTLYGVWERVDDAHTVSFFLYMNLKTINDNADTDRTIETKTEYYTNLVAAKKLLTDTNSWTVVGTKTYSGILESDKIIRGMVEGNTDNRTGVILDSIPDDETVLAAVREQLRGTDGKAELITNGGGARVQFKDMEGNDIPAEDITTNNFSIQWYVFKKQATWHIDGILVPKKGYLNIRKNFYGDEKAISTVTNQKGNSAYAILVRDNNGNLLKTLRLTDPEVKKEGNTYTWTLELPQYVTYTIEEINYGLKKSGDIAILPEYMISGSSGNDSGWAIYQNPISVMVEAYSEDTTVDAYQTVSLQNSYIPTNSIAIHKVDEFGHAIGDVEFTLQKQDENGVYQEQEIYQDQDGRLYLAQVDGTEAAGSKIRVDSQGDLLLYGLDSTRADGNYQLVETQREGYSAVTIPFEVWDGGKVSLRSEANDAVLESIGKGAYSLRIINHSDPVAVTVTKEWGEGRKLPVKIQLYRNGTEVGQAATLSDENAWTYTWNNLPKYVGGEPVTYTVRENWIGDVAYSPSADSTDGYAGYVVVTSEPSYWKDGRTVSTITEADQVAFTIANRVDTGELLINKKDQYGNLLTGAKFALYEILAVTDENGKAVLDEDGIQKTRVGDTVVKEAVSVNGQVNFGQVQAGTYQLVETEAPPGYQLSKKIYTVTVTSSGYTLTDEEGKPVSTIINEANIVPLPESGGAGTTIYTLGGIAVLAMGLMYGCGLRRRRERRED
ncbi:SpaA isopeptide-forming pilin-related protein [Hominifimenecus sp. rT4P-3]|uniref:SpaA isopeptide-forming pilin-related protein n=1 Tax=Hominifimenecus sp. rT4P-3 TaxID=3242979 RepID=UPI003DA3D2A4